ncbi:MULTISPECIES: MraY family glycosyltransferase [Tsukamurella]|uniref:MraY family glycosyltransferase n=1 Tax=Tsukamurella strandjordii TaxID=147577 RepID=A0AA90NM44_9ACTN|nr:MULTISPECIES: MraY family glycosyltransferase [Tsukamurella]MDP0400214.1 MraY family glycosyltransferase [Tsukamurella strandjordii]GIZ98547.1 decaprenyl-phosphate N-acetylglucosaminephosphotransferase [Tsukamurella sp. TY48]
MRELLVVGLTAAVVTFFATSLVRVLATRFGAVAVPRTRDVHVVPTPRLGGVGIYIGMALGIFVAAQLPALTRGFVYSRDVIAVVVAGGVIVLVGVIDDRWGIDALTKLVGQIFAAGVLVVMGVSWNVIYNPIANTTVVLGQLEAGLLTVLLTVATINALNFIDGLDGLLAGVAAIAALSILVFSLGLMLDSGGDAPSYPPAMIAAALFGACMGFLPHNFQPARIFMGDSGSMLLGLTLAAASTSATGRISANAYGATDMFTLLLPLLLAVAVMFVPMLDLLLAVVRRTRAGVHPFTADKMHLHHRLLQLGHSQRRVVVVIYLWVGVLGLSAAASTLLPPTLVAPLFGAGLLSALVFTVVPRIVPRLRERYSETRRSSASSGVDTRL